VLSLHVIQSFLEPQGKGKGKGKGKVRNQFTQEHVEGSEREKTHSSTLSLTLGLDVMHGQ
jgi:hypothetical protein